MIPVLTGCTATGKTGMAVALASRRRLEVISADSRQVYRHMDIGTAKPSASEREAVPHHLLDVADPDGSYSAGAFARDARRLAAEIASRGAVPLVTGGTGLYLAALAGPFDELPGTCRRLRTVLSSCSAADPAFLRRCLERLDPASAASIGPADAVRTVRALEIVLTTGRRASSLRRGARDGSFRIARLQLPREELRRRIDERVDRMFSAGLVEEVSALLARGWGRDAAPGRTIGYREVLDALEEGVDPLSRIGAVKVDTWRFARRQRNMLGRLGAVDVAAGDLDALEEALFGLEDEGAEGT